MAFWCLMKQSKLKILSNQFKRCYFQIPGPCLPNHTSPHARIWVLAKPNSVINKTQIEFASNVRFFAAPVQAKPKQEEKDTSGPRLNEQITAEFVRLVTEEGHRVVSRREALERARHLKVDLVEVQRNAKPPVCKLMDYHKETYKQQIKEKDRAKSKSEVTLRKGDCKEVRFSGKTEQKDLQMKANMVKRLMERGYRVKCMAMGTEDQDLGGLLSRLSALIEDFSVVESGPRVEKKQAYVIVRHAKFGPSKKGSGKKASKVVGTTTTDVQMVATIPPTVNPSLNQSPIQSEEIVEPAGLGLKTEDEYLSEEADESISLSLEIPDKDLDKKNLTWSVINANDDSDSVFDFRDEAKVAKSSGDLKMKSAPETVSSAANNFSDFMHPRPIVDYTRTETVLSSPSEAPPGTENRYRMEPRNKYPHAKSMDGKGTSARGSMRSEPQFPNQEHKGIETNTSLFGNMNFHADDVPKQEQLIRSSPGSPASSFGIFSAPKENDTPEKNGLLAEVNRYQKGNTFDSTRNPRPRGVSGNTNSPSSNADGGQRLGVDEGRQGKWGMFSRESSNAIPSRNSESQAKVQQHRR